MLVKIAELMKYWDENCTERSAYRACYRLALIKPNLTIDDSGEKIDLLRRMYYQCQDRIARYYLLEAINWQVSLPCVSPSALASKSPDSWFDRT